MGYEGLFNNYDILPLPIILLDKNYKIIECNEATIDVFMYKYSEVINSYIGDLIASNVSPGSENFNTLLNDARQSDYGELVSKNRRKDSSVIICQWQYKTIYSPSEERLTLLIARDVTKEKMRCQEKEIYEAMISQTPSLISIYKDMNPLFTNKAFDLYSDGLLLDNNNSLNNLLKILNSFEHIDSINELKNNESYAFDLEIKHQSKKHNLHLVCFNITLDNIVHHAIVMDDYTNIYKMNESIDQTKKLLTDLDVLASLGTMTAGLMHEINNPLSYLSSNIEFLKSVFPKLKIESSKDIKDEIIETFDDIEIAIYQILEIVKNIKGFVNFDDDKLFSVSDEINSVLKLAKNDYKYDCEIEANLDTTLSLKGSSVKFRQIVFNLLSNAIYAIKARKSNNKLKIEISTKNINDNIEITFKDYGIGIEGKRLDDIFRMFSTDKPKGVGTGLGLALIKDFIEEDFSGTISVTSQVGEFSEFKITIPLYRRVNVDTLHSDDINCWEYMKCGREFDGKNVAELGVCPVLENNALHGTHGGIKAGRCCWIVAGTLCNGDIQGTYASKHESCRKCNFYKKVKSQGKNKIMNQSELLEMIRENYFNDK